MILHSEMGQPEPQCTALRWCFRVWNGAELSFSELLTGLASEDPTGGQSPEGRLKSTRAIRVFPGGALQSGDLNKSKYRAKVLPPGSHGDRQLASPNLLVQPRPVAHSGVNGPSRRHGLAVWPTCNNLRVFNVQVSPSVFQLTIQSQLSAAPAAPAAPKHVVT